MFLKTLIPIIILLLSLSKSQKQITVTFNEEENTITYKNKTYLLLDTSEFKSPVTELVEDHPLTKKQLIINFLLTLFLLFSAGAMSGLTVGFMSIDTLILELKLNNGTEEEKYYAEKILNITNNHHWLLVTLLLCNSFCAEAMPIVLHKLVGEAWAIILSVTLLLFFGEIIPTALCTGPNQMKIACYLSPLTYSLMIITYPISYPIALLMDYVIGKQSKSRFCNSDLKELIKLHTMDSINKFNYGNEDLINNGNMNFNYWNFKNEKKNDCDDSIVNKSDIGLSKEQVQVMISTLDNKNQKITKIIIPIRNTEMISDEMIINNFTLDDLLTKGYSRLPVYEGNDKKKILGVLRIKQLIGIYKNNGKKIKDLKLTLIPPLIISSELTAVELLNEFKKSMNHIAFVAKNFKRNMKIYHSRSKYGKIDSNILNAEIIGIVTLEDVLGKLFNVQVFDYERENENNKKFFKSNSNSFFDNLTTRNNSRSTVNNSFNDIFSRSRSSNNTYVNIDEISPDNSYKLMEEN